MTDWEQTHVGQTAQRNEMLEVLRRETAGAYEIRGVLGMGGMATVYLAQDLALDRKVAIKLMSAAVAERDELIERFRREARTAASLSHPHIIPIYAVGQAERFLYFVMKCVEGRTLRSIVDEVGRLPVEMVQAIFAQVGDALAYAHRQGVVHRDIKPENIMIDNEGWAVVTDFGIAKVTESGNLTLTGVFIGTPTYMSPEQCSHEDITGASDQYSLGVVTYEMLAGKPPFSGPALLGVMSAHVNTPPPPLRDLRPDCPSELDDVLMRMLAKSPLERFPTLEEAVTAVGSTPLPRDDPVRTHMIDLAKAGGNAEVIARVRTPSSPIPVGRPVSPVPGSSSRKKSLAKWLSVTAVVLIAAAAWWILQIRSSPSGDVPAAGQTAAERAGVPGRGRIAALRLSAPTSPIEVGGALALSLEAIDSAGTLVPPRSVLWLSSNPSVATVSGNGVVSGVGAGATQLTASVGPHRATVEVIVERPAAQAPATPSPSRVSTVEVIQTATNISVGDSVALTALARDASGRAVSNAEFTWVSGDPSIATVSEQGGVTGVRGGTVAITAASGGYSFTITMTVASETVSTVQVSSPGTLSVGQSVQLSVAYRAADGELLQNRSTTWSTDRSDVATVSPAGVVTTVAAGQAVITATAEGKFGSVTVRVEAVSQAEPLPSERPLIEALINEYARAVQSRDIDEIKRVYPGLPPESEQAWRDLFALGELTVAVTDIRVTALSSDSARALFRQTIEGRRVERNTTQFEAVLTRTTQGWRIASIR